MKCIPFSELKTERLYLRRLVESDWEVISYLRTDKEVNKLVKRPNADTKDKAIDFIEKTIEGIDTGKIYYWCISLKTRPDMIGSICLWNISEDRKTAETGYDLSPEYQRKGIMQEAMQCVLDFGFKTLHLKMIEAYTHKKNEPSKNLLVRNNFILNKKRKDRDNKDNAIYEKVSNSSIATGRRDHQK
ncbi:MAG: GNAT family N-acetyltransferase [Flavobacteriaceae bacterium]|nr:GNAT family N-acetyltransferase [Muriicola sp.]NNL38455.1 GNAT family N-acetyltransferase [Flavobacteriaceae bacterium]